MAKIHFNLAAAHADNPKGDKEKALIHYTEAIRCLEQIPDNSKDKNNLRDLQRIAIRMGDIYLCMKDFPRCREIISDVRKQKLDRQLAIYIDHLEAKLEYAMGNFIEGEALANKVIEEAKTWCRGFS
ncbi:MAG: hypothetical protein HWD61_05180 [Parachlamydiaceae bacterium]|nr:MAG: hypothetical protein HWD61_05180 [Parachlamydiaceae bacterium]